MKHSFWTSYDLAFIIYVLSLAMFLIGLAIGWIIAPASKVETRQVGYVINQCDDCDYITPNFTYHGWCQTANDLLNLDKIRKQMEQDFTFRLNDTLNNFCPRWLETQQQEQAQCIAGCKIKDS